MGFYRLEDIDKGLEPISKVNNEQLMETIEHNNEQLVETIKYNDKQLMETIKYNNVLLVLEYYVKKVIWEETSCYYSLVYDFFYNNENADIEKVKKFFT